MIEAIDILAPYLPRGFVPRNLPFSTVQKSKAHCPNAVTAVIGPKIRKLLSVFVRVALG